MMSVTDAHAAAGTPLDSRPVSRSSVGHLSVRSQADTEGGRGSGTPQPGAQFFPLLPQFLGSRKSAHVLGLDTLHSLCA
jgi:hypothetical protein